ncbi:DUF6630 family protein [Dyella silvae]|uniref:DUF6630 family protein n=1 Tax=Dyella silvae TaxID=2994424 RepID=UPI0022651985|nr:hypothetical protein [Dyella silvae]
MSDFDDDFQTDHHFDDDEDSLDAKVWQLLLLINPGDDDSAFQQFTAYRDAVGDTPEDEVDVAQVVVQVADWRSAFRVDAEDTRVLVQAINELASRWNLSIDWDGDPDEDEFHADIDSGTLLGTAYDNLAPHGYALWVIDTEDDSVAGWMALARNTEGMRELATELGIHLRLGSEVG